MLAALWAVRHCSLGDELKSKPATAKNEAAVDCTIEMYASKALTATM